MTTANLPGPGTPLTVTLNLPPETQEKLRARANASGQAVAEFVESLIAREVAAATVEEALAPFRRQVQESGLSEDELDSFFEEVRQEVWEEKQARQP